MTTQPPPELPAASLYFREGGSDKEYHARIEAQAGGYVVAVAWGRRGGTLQTGTKTQGPVSMAEASQIFQRLVAEKERKGYQRSAVSGQPETQTSAPAESRKPKADGPVAMPSPPYRAQLCNPIEDDELDGFVARLTDQWCAQEKYDGKRVILLKRGGQLTALNRHGKITDLDPAIIKYAWSIKGNYVLDGEAIGPDYYAFDLLGHKAEDYRALPLGKRLQLLKRFVGHPNGWPIHVAPLVIGRTAAEKFVAEMRAANKEGVVFKDLLAPYTPDRPHRGGPWRKYKFCATCSAVVLRHNDQRSVGLALYINATEGTEIGNVTIPPNHPLPAVGAVVEVRYLYYFEGGSLYQPVYLGERADVPASECTIEKQKLKQKSEVRSQESEEPTERSQNE